MLEFYNSTYPKAKKEYKCDLCDQKIKVGEKYHRYSGKYDGDEADSHRNQLLHNIIETMKFENVK